MTIKKTLKKISGFNKIEVKDILADYKAIFASNKSRIIDVQSEYHVSWCSIIIAIYKKYRNKNYVEEKSIEMTEMVIFNNMGAETIAKYTAQALDRAKDKFLYIVRASKKQEIDFFANTFVFHRPVDNDNKYHLNVKKCFYYEFFRENKMEELMSIACKWDLISWASGIDEEKHKIKFERNISLVGNNEKNCEFIFERIE